MPATPAWPPKSLSRLFVRTPLSDGAAVELDAGQANYLGNVMRLGVGSEVLLFDGQSGEWVGRIAHTGKKRMTLSVEQRTREPVPRVGLLVLLKTFQQLGYFVMMNEVPKPILQHVANCAGYDTVPGDFAAYDAGSVRRRHSGLVRDFVGVSGWCEASQKVMVDACREAARARDDLADIINVALEDLVRQRYELPAFATILRAARSARAG